MNLKNNCYLLVGKNENWETAFKEKLWGVAARNRKQWEEMKPNNLLAFYVTKPTQLVIGFGVVNDKFVDKKLTWPTEKLLGESIWPYKISLKILYVCENWQDGISLPTKINLQTSKRKINYELFNFLVETADKKWNTSISKLVNTIMEES